MSIIDSKSATEYISNSKDMFQSKWIFFSAALNAFVLFFINTFFSISYVYTIISIMIGLIMITESVYITIKKSADESLKYLLFGCNLIFFGACLETISTILLKELKSPILFIFLLVSSLIIFLFSLVKEFLKLKKVKSTKSISVSVGVLGVLSFLLAWFLKDNFHSEKIVFGTITGFIGVSMFMSSYWFFKAYCFYIIEKHQ